MVLFLRKSPLQEGRRQNEQSVTAYLADALKEIICRNKAEGLTYYQTRRLLEKLSFELKSEGQTRLRVILASPFLPGHTTCFWTICFADDCQGWDECVSTASAPLWLPCQNPTEAAGRWRQRAAFQHQRRRRKHCLCCVGPSPFSGGESSPPALAWPLPLEWKVGCGGWKGDQRTTCWWNPQSASPSRMFEAEELNAALWTRKCFGGALP